MITLDKAILLSGQGLQCLAAIIELEDRGEDDWPPRFVVRVIRAVGNKYARTRVLRRRGLVAARNAFNRVMAREANRL